MEIGNDNSMVAWEDMSAEEVYAEGELFLSARGGLKFVEFCDSQDWAILGIEGGTFDGTVFTPDLTLIRDYSAERVLKWDHYRNDCNAKARAFLEAFSGENTLRFYITFAIEHDGSRERNEG